MNHITQLFGYGQLHSTTEVPGDSNLFPREVQCARPTTSLSSKGRKAAKELSYYEGNQDWHIHRDYNRTMPPIVYIGRGLISDKAVAPPLEGTSTPVKATSDELRPEQELLKSREEPRAIHDNHSTNATCASMDECINENYNQQLEVTRRATSVTKPKDRVLRDQTNMVHYGTQPKKNNCAGKSKDTLATGTSYSPRKRQDGLTMIGWPCSPRKQKSSPSKKRSAGISKTAFDPLGAQARRARPSSAQNTQIEVWPTRSTWHLIVSHQGTTRTRTPYEPNQVRRRRSAAAAQTTTLRI
jgi:hypothetical protein